MYMRTPRSPLAAFLLAALVSLGCDTASGSPMDREDAALDAATTTASAAASDTAREALLRRADLGRINGSPASLVWLVVISDFQCPYCKVWHDETAPLIERDYVRTGKIRVAYLNLPISSHRNAWPAHESAMCAAEQGKFFPVADAIFATQGDWKTRLDAPAYFDSLTRTLPVDHARLRACVADGQLRPLIKADYDRSSRIGIGSTPTFLIGSKVLIGAQPYEAFRRALDDALTAAGAR